MVNTLNTFKRMHNGVLIKWRDPALHLGLLFSSFISFLSIRQKGFLEICTVQNFSCNAILKDAPQW